MGRGQPGGAEAERGAEVAGQAVGACAGRVPTSARECGVNPGPRSLGVSPAGTRGVPVSRVPGGPHARASEPASGVLGCSPARRGPCCSVLVCLPLSSAQGALAAGCTVRTAGGPPASPALSAGQPCEVFLFLPSAEHRHCPSFGAPLTGGRQSVLRAWARESRSRRGSLAPSWPEAALTGGFLPRGPRAQGCRRQ